MAGPLTRALAVAAAAAGWVASPAGASEVALGDCGWAVRSDPAVVNVLYPDEAAVYYSTRLPMPPPGVEYRIHGQFPHARYMSFVAYNGLPMDALLDVDIAADEGSVNPFVPGAGRDASEREYTVRIVAERAPTDPAGREPGTLYVGGGQLGTPAPVFYILYRVYVADRGMGAAGGVPLPSVEAVLPGQGDVDVGQLPCGAAHSTFDALPLSALHEHYARASLPAPARPSASATNPPAWSVETGLTAALLGRAGEGDLVSGGPASNPHNRYVAATVSRGHGEVLAIRGRAPTTPATFDGEPVMGEGQLRYWSFCQNSRTTRYVDCLSDSQVELDEDGWYTIAISDPAKRPRTARNWLPFGPEPEGQVLYRHMLPSASFFGQSAQGAAAAGVPLEQAMGDYYPRAAYCSAAQFEVDACGLRPG